MTLKRLYRKVYTAYMTRRNPIKYAEKVGVNLYFQFSSTVTEAAHAAAHTLPFGITTFAHPAARFTD